ncbi:MAG: hypothetical protein EPN77_19450 [Candidimonas sp.]|nr:MAG: hypothetical protein EPN77_19450 [Candidimonas sp.]
MSTFSHRCRTALSLLIALIALSLAGYIAVSGNVTYLPLAVGGALAALAIRRIGGGREHLRAILTRVACWIPALAAIFAWRHSASSAAALPSIARGIVSGAGLFGEIAITAWLVIRVQRVTVRGWTVAAVWDLLLGLADRLLIYAFLVTGLRAFAPVLQPAIAAAIAAPGVALGGVVGAAAMFVALRVPTYAPTTAKHIRALGTRNGAAERAQRSNEDIRRTALHEAGHALLYAVLPRLPDDMAISVRTAAGPADPDLGVLMHKPMALPRGEKFLRWEMLMVRAGAAAERVIYGHAYEGIRDDSQRWVNLACRYLGAGFGEVFFAPPEEPSHVEHNRAALNALRAEQDLALREFFEQNLAVLYDLSDMLAEAGTLRDHALLEQIVRVTFTHAIPKLSLG